MKKIEAIIKPFKLDEVRDALTGIGPGVDVGLPETARALRSTRRGPKLAAEPAAARTGVATARVMASTGGQPAGGHSRRPLYEWLAGHP